MPWGGRPRTRASAAAGRGRAKRASRAPPAGAAAAVVPDPPSPDLARPSLPRPPVCGRVREADFEYRQSGVRALTATEVLTFDGRIKTVGAPGDGARSGAAPRPGARAAAAVAAGAAGAAALLLAL
jgi:hypothetical protein